LRTTLAPGRARDHGPRAIGNRSEGDRLGRSGSSRTRACRAGRGACGTILWPSINDLYDGCAGPLRDCAAGIGGKIAGTWDYVPKKIFPRRYGRAPGRTGRVSPQVEPQRSQISRVRLRRTWARLCVPFRERIGTPKALPIVARGRAAHPGNAHGSFGSAEPQRGSTIRPDQIDRVVGNDVRYVVEPLGTQMKQLPGTQPPRTPRNSGGNFVSVPRGSVGVGSSIPRHPQGAPSATLGFGGHPLRGKDRNTEEGAGHRKSRELSVRLTHFISFL
jgi:hypothetical protein